MFPSPRASDLRLAADADVEKDGCAFNEYDTYTCSGPFGECASLLELTVTAGAFFDQDNDDAAPTIGNAERTDTLVVEVSEVEAQIAAMFEATPAEERLLPAAPSVDEMLVAGSEAAAMLSRLFTEQQQPHVVFPRSFALEGDQHRRTQAGARQLYVDMETLAPTSAEAALALDDIARNTGARLGARGRRAQAFQDGLPSQRLHDLHAQVQQLEKLLAEKVRVD